uniref:Uncharacterized protein n=1 Tax=Xenopus tropicalis TaxID=8364 RepID=A0A1B8XS43_XENTR
MKLIVFKERKWALMKLIVFKEWGFSPTRGQFPFVLTNNLTEKVVVVKSLLKCLCFLVVFPTDSSFLTFYIRYKTDVM